MNRFAQIAKELKTCIAALAAFNFGLALERASWMPLVHGVAAITVMVGACMAISSLFPRKTQPESK